MKLRRHDLTFPRLDLPASHVTALSLVATLHVPLDRDLPEDSIFDLFMDPTVSFYTAMAYRTSGTTHFISAQLGDQIEDPVESLFGSPPAAPPDDPLDLEDDRLQLEIGYAIDPTHTLPRPPGTLNNEATLLRWLGEDQEPKTWTCFVNFAFDVAPETRLPSWFPLPHEVTGGANGSEPPLSEIQGIRGVKLAHTDRGRADAVEYSVVIDHTEGNRLLAVVEFTLSAPCSSQVPAMALDRGNAIGRTLRLPA